MPYKETEGVVRVGSWKKFEDVVVSFKSAYLLVYIVGQSAWRFFSDGLDHKAVKSTLSISGNIFLHEFKL